MYVWLQLRIDMKTFVIAGPNTITTTAGNQVPNMTFNNFIANFAKGEIVLLKIPHMHNG